MNWGDGTGMKAFTLAVEGGGTKTRVLLADADGKVVAREQGGPASPLYVRRGRFKSRARRLLERMAREAEGRGGRIAQVVFGAPMDGPVLQEIVQDLFGDVPVDHVSEGRMGLACHGLRWGMTLVAGTGATCSARRPRGRRWSCGGLGPQFGDEGSGAWIGREAVAAVLRGEDGRSEQTILRDVLCETYDLASPFEIIRYADRNGFVSATKIASFVPHVFAAARGGDAVACAICRAAGRALGRLVLATAARGKWGGRRVPLVLTGGVFHAGTLVLGPLRRILRTGDVALEVYPVVTEPAEGLIRFVQMNGGSGA